MKRTKRILVVEDRSQWRHVLQANLQRVGFHVDIASSTEEVRALLKDDFYHLIILDIRLDEADQTNAEGMELLQELNDTLGTSIAIVMLSGYGTREQMRSAFRHYKVADFMEKQSFDNIQFRQHIQRIFEDEIPINLNLNIHWDSVHSLAEAVRNIKIGQERIQPGTPLQRRGANELDDLLCRLFAEANQVMVKPLTPGYSGTGVLRVQPFFNNGGGQATVVKFGDFRKIDEEFRNFQTYVRPFIGGGRRTTALNLQRTALLGGIVYSLLGVTGDQQEDFGMFYQRASISTIKMVLDGLFRHTCGAWYASPGKLQPHYLTAEYQQMIGLDLEQLDHQIKQSLKSVEMTDRLYFNHLNTERTFRNPLKAVAGQHLVRPTYLCITHGDMNERNILVDEVQQVWLIDFRHTGPGHILRDVACLDAVIRLQLLSSNEVTLAERLGMEEKLAAITHFNQVEALTGDLTGVNPALCKAYEISLYLRSIAGKLVAQNPSNDFSEYHIASLYYALNTLRFASLGPVQHEHALLSASLLVDQLGM